MDKLKYYSDGPADGQTMVFIHGWPDTPALWQRQILEFSKEYHCIRFALPNYEQEDPKKRLYTFSEITDAAIAAIVEIIAKSKFDKVILIGHDWGAFLSYHIESKRPDLIERLITMDVGAVLKPASIFQMLAIVSYQWALIISYLVGIVCNPLGNLFTRIVSSAVGVHKIAKPKWQMNYLYLHYWRLLLTRKLPTNKRLPKCPFLYLFGARKPFMFHTEGWLEKVKLRSENSVISFEQSGHWFLLQESNRVNEVIRTWLQQ